MQVTLEWIKQLCRLIAGAPADFPPLTDQHIKRLAWLCEQHQIFAWVYHLREPLQRANPNLSPAFFERARDYLIFNQTRNLVQIHFLRTLIPLLSACSGRYMILKGIVLAQTVYPAAYLRTFGDIDLLVQPRDIGTLDRLLTGRGFRQGDDLYTAFPAAIIRKYAFARHYLRYDPCFLAVDVHQNLSGKLHPFQFDAAAIFNSLRHVTIEDLSLPTLGEAETVLYLLYHAFKHYYFKLIWLIDLFLALRQLNLDPMHLAEQIERYRLTRMWQFYRRLAADLFGEQVAPPGRAPRLSRRLLTTEIILAGNAGLSPSRARLIYPLLYLPGYSAAGRYLLRQLFPPRDTVADFYPPMGLAPTWSAYLKCRAQAIRELVFPDRKGVSPCVP